MAEDRESRTPPNSSGSRLRRLVNDPFCGLSHLAGAALSVLGLIILLARAHGRPWHVVSFAIYGLTLVVLYSASGMAHSLHASHRLADRFNRLDYAAIFLLIAGTYTPVCLITLRGPLGWTLLLVEWTFALVGMWSVLRGPGQSNLLRTVLYLVMAWLAVLVAPVLVRRIEPAALVWLIAGGVVYSLGAIVFVRRWPVLWPGRFGSHDLWHCMVLIGSACHFVAMIRYIGA